MNSLIRILQVSTVLACALALFSVQGNAVTRVKSGSNYGGTDTNSNGVTDCAQMLTPPYPEGCQAYALLTNSAPITINGSITDVTEYAFSDGSSADFGDIFDVYDLGIGNYTDVNVALSGSTLGVFACGGTQLDSSTPSSVSYSTNQANFGVPCTPILASATSGNPTTDAFGTNFLFTLNGDGITFGSATDPIPSTDDLVVYVVPSTAAPEPATVTLMGLGLAALAGLLVRRAA
jgi:hypothetical protein